MKPNGWLGAQENRRRVLVGVLLLVAVVGGYASSAQATTSAASGRLTVSWPGTGFPGYELVITGRTSGSAPRASLILERREGRAWRRVAGGRPARSGAFALSWKAPKLIGSIGLRVLLVRSARVVGQRSARVHIRPLPIVLEPSEITSAPPPGQAGWIRFRLPASQQDRARAASASGCVRVPTGATVINNNFVAAGYSKAYPDGFLDKINLVQCNGLTGGIYGTPVSLDQAVGTGSLDLGAGFAQVAGLSSSTTVKKSFNQPLGQVTCSGGASATLSGKVGIDVTPTMKVAFSGFSVSSATFQLTGTADASVGIDAKAGATCKTKNPVALVKNYPIATFEGDVGPFPVVVELRGELDLSGSATATVAASDQIDAKATVTGGVKYSSGRFSPITGSRFTITNTGPNVNGTADATATLSPSIEALLYGVAGPQITLNAGLHLHADTTAKHCWTLDAPVSAQASFDGFGHRSPTYTFDSGDSQLGQASGPCTGSGAGSVNVTNPGSQTSTTGAPVSLQIEATDTDGGALSYSQSGLPPGLTLDSGTGLITGTPTTPGTSNVTVTATDASGAVNSTSFTWTVRGPSWTLSTVASPAGAQQTYLKGVSCISSSSCTAVGSYDDSSSNTDTLVESWNGSAWAMQPSPDPTSPRTNGFVSQFYGVSCASGTMCEAVGTYLYNNAGNNATLAEGWDGSHWVVQSPANPVGSAGTTLTSVSCAATTTACMAVGYYSDGMGSTYALTEQWNGSSWALQSAPTPSEGNGTSDGQLNSVSCTAATACIAIGVYRDSNGTQVTLAEQWNGTSWTVMSTPNPAPPPSSCGSGNLACANYFNSVSCISATACTAVGSYVTSANGGQDPMVEQWNGTSWTIQPSPANPQGSSFSESNGVSCLSASACEAVGDSTYPTGPFAEVWDGITWTVQPLASQPAYGVLWADSCVSPSWCMAVGTSGTPTQAIAELYS